MANANLGVEKISRSSYVPGEDVGAINEGQKADLPIDATIDVYEIQVDDTYFDMYELKFLAGRKFSKEYATDSQAVILNETARRLLLYDSPENAINTKFLYITEHTLEVIGVVDDWHQESLKQSFEPMVFIYRPANNGYYSLRLQTQEPQKLLDEVNRYPFRITISWWFFCVPVVVTILIAALGRAPSLTESRHSRSGQGPALRIEPV